MRSQIVINSVCLFYKINMLHLKKRSRKRAIVRARFTIMYLLRKHTSVTFKEAAANFDFDHTAAVHGCITARGWLDVDRSYRDDISAIESLFL